MAGVEQHVLRYWEDEFEALKPGKNRSGQRLYQKKDVDVVMEIKRLLYDEMFTIAGAKKKLKEAKKGNPQLEFGFDREKFVQVVKKTKHDLESVLKMLK